MPIEPQDPVVPPPTLAQMQRQQREQLQEVETARAHLDQATQKLRILETAITLQVQTDQGTQPPLVVPNPDLRYAQVIFNPHAKGASKGLCSPEQILVCLRKYGIVGDLHVRTSGKAVRQLVQAAAKQPLGLVIVAGGDGTIEAVAKHLIGTTTTLGIIPLGTMNNLARSLGIPLSLEAACALLRTGITRHIDVGRISTRTKPKGVYFLEMAGIGLSAHALNFGEGYMKGQWGKLLEALGNAFASKIDTVTIAYDDEAAFQVQTHVVTIVNAPLFAGNMFIGPDAKLDDGMLDVALYSGMSKRDLEHHFRTIAAGKRVDDPRITFRHIRHMRVRTRRALAAHADLAMFTPQQIWELAVVPGALSVIVGNGIGLSLPVERAAIVPPLTGPQLVPAPPVALPDP